MITRSKSISKEDAEIVQEALKQAKTKSVLDLKRERIVKRKVKEPLPFVLPDWTNLYQRKMKEAAIKSLPAEEPYKKIKVRFDNLGKEDLEDMEEPIVVPIKMVESTTTSMEIIQPAAGEKVEEVTPSGELLRKIKLMRLHLLTNTKGEPIETVVVSCAENKDTPTVINLEEPYKVVADEESNVDEVVAVAVREEVCGTCW
ncbi:ATPase [Sesbania bispinosa]|nr:ATPase [Sesbania bispinosa]